MRQNLQKAAAQQRRRNGVGPIYRHLVAFETSQDRRFGRVGEMRRPRYLLDALQAGEPVQVPVSRIPPEHRPPGYGLSERILVTVDM